MDNNVKINLNPWNDHPLSKSSYNPEKTKLNSDIALVSAIFSFGACLFLAASGKSRRWTLSTLALGGGSLYVMSNLWSKRFEQNEKIRKAIQQTDSQAFILSADTPQSVMDRCANLLDLNELGNKIYKSQTPWLKAQENETDESFFSTLQGTYGSNYHLMLNGECQRTILHPILSCEPTAAEKESMLKGLGYTLIQEKTLPKDTASQYNILLNQKRQEKWVALTTAQPAILEQLPPLLRGKVDFTAQSQSEWIARLKFEQTCNWLRDKGISGSGAVPATAIAAMHFGVPVNVDAFKQHLKEKLPEFAQCFWRSNLIIADARPILQIEVIDYVPKNEGTWIADAQVCENHLPIKAVLRFDLDHLTRSLKGEMTQIPVPMIISTGNHAIDLDPAIVARQSFYESNLKA